VFFFLCAVYNQIQHKLQMSSPHHLDYQQQQQADPLFDYKNQQAARAEEAARAAAAAAKKTPEYTASRADTIAENARTHQIYDSIACPDCKKKAFLFGDINQKCSKCKSGGFRRKSKSQRRKKSKSQRRRKSIKRRH
jgi:hypothetical protein